MSAYDIAHHPGLLCAQCVAYIPLLSLETYDLMCKWRQSNCEHATADSISNLQLPVYASRAACQWATLCAKPACGLWHAGHWQCLRHQFSTVPTVTPIPNELGLGRLMGQSLRLGMVVSMADFLLLVFWMLRGRRDQGGNSPYSSRAYHAAKLQSLQIDFVRFGIPDSSRTVDRELWHSA